MFCNWVDAIDEVALKKFAESAKHHGASYDLVFEATGYVVQDIVNTRFATHDSFDHTEIETFFFQGAKREVGNLLSRDYDEL